jgi:hypothetical protein
MALTELQMLNDKDELYRNFNTAANNLNSLFHKLEDLAEFIGKIEGAELDALLVPNTGTIREDMADFRTALNELILFYKGESVTQTKPVSVEVDLMRTMR